MGKERTVATLKRGNPIVPAGAVQSHRAIGTLLIAEWTGSTLRIQVAAALFRKEQASRGIIVVRTAKAAHHHSLHVVMVVCASCIAGAERGIYGVPEKWKVLGHVGKLGASCGAAGRHNVSNEDWVAAVVGFCQIVLESGAAGAVTDDPAFLIVVDVTELIDGIVDDALTAGAGGIVKLPVPRVPLDKVDVAIYSNRLAAPVSELVGGKHAELLVAGIVPSVDHENVVRELCMTFAGRQQHHHSACNRKERPQGCSHYDLPFLAGRHSPLKQ